MVPAIWGGGAVYCAVVGVLERVCCDNNGCSNRCVYRVSVTANPTANPISAPATTLPTAAPSAAPSAAPTAAPTAASSPAPTNAVPPPMVRRGRRPWAQLRPTRPLCPPPRLPMVQHPLQFPQPPQSQLPPQTPPRSRQQTLLVPLQMSHCSLPRQRAKMAASMAPPLLPFCCSRS